MPGGLLVSWVDTRAGSDRGTNQNALDGCSAAGLATEGAIGTTAVTLPRVSWQGASGTAVRSVAASAPVSSWQLSFETAAGSCWCTCTHLKSHTAVVTDGPIRLSSKRIAAPRMPSEYHLAEPMRTTPFGLRLTGSGSAPRAAPSKESDVRFSYASVTPSLAPSTRPGAAAVPEA